MTYMIENILVHLNRPTKQQIIILTFGPLNSIIRSSTMLSGSIPKKSTIIPFLKYYIATFEKSKDFSPFSIYGVRKFRTNTRRLIMLEIISKNNIAPLILKLNAM